jgi:hypothetical protein
MGSGTLRFKSKSKPSCKGGKIVSKGNEQYELTLEKGQEYVVTYQAL